MNAKIKVEKEFDLKTLFVKAGVRRWESSEVDGESDTEEGNNIPCKVGELWCPIIDIDSGIIQNWEIGKTADIHYKVADCLGFEIKDANNETILSEEDGYVPNTLCINGEGYGDYLILQIEETGKIKDWKFNLSDFYGQED